MIIFYFFFHIFLITACSSFLERCHPVTTLLVYVLNSFNFPHFIFIASEFSIFRHFNVIIVYVVPASGLREFTIDRCWSVYVCVCVYEYDLIPCIYKSLWFVIVFVGRFVRLPFMPMFVFGYRSNAVGYCHISCCQIKYMLPDFPNNYISI